MDTNFSDRIKRFFSGNMSPEEQQQFDQDLQQNEQLAQEMAEHLATNALLKGYQNQKEEDELIAALRKRRKKRRFFFVFSLLIVVTIVALGIAKNASTDEPTPKEVPLSFFFEISETTTPENDETLQEPIIEEPDEATEPTSSNPAPTPPVGEPKEIIPVSELPEPIAIWEREVIEEQLFLKALAGSETGATLDTFDKLQIIFKNSTIAEYPTILKQGPQILPQLEIAEQKQLQLLIAATYYRLNELESALAFAKLADDQNTACCYILAIKLQVVSLWRLGRKEASRETLEKLETFPIPTIRQHAEALLSEI